jgi:putative hydrolase of the HAD superfamily
VTRALFLDAGGVFMFPDPDRVRAAVAPEGVAAGPGEQLRAHAVAMQAVDAARSGEVYWEAYARALGVPQARAAVLGRSMKGLSWSQVLEASVSGLRSLAPVAAAIAIVSNTEGGVEEELRRNRVCQVGPGAGVPVAAVVMSSAVGVEKPDPAIFAVALRATGSSASGTVHVGDSVYYDVEGARAAGLLPIHFDPLRLCDHADHAHVASLVELVPVLRQNAN